jgi:hypothetical protein
MTSTQNIKNQSTNQKKIFTTIGLREPNRPVSSDDEIEYNENEGIWDAYKCLDVIDLENTS